MPGPFRVWLGVLWRRSAALFILAVLAGLGYWGHRHHWKFSHDPAASADARVGRAGADAVARRARAGASTPSRAGAAAHNLLSSQVRFESLRAIERSGIQVAEVQHRPLDDYVLVNGVVAYDQRRRAQLSSRVPGIVWRVEKHLGDEVQKGDVLAIVEASDVGGAKSELLQTLGQVELKSKILGSLDATVVATNQIRRVEAELREARIQLFDAQQKLVNLGLPIRAEELVPLSDEQRARRLRFLGLPEAVTRDLDSDLTTANLIPLVAPFEGVVIGHEMAIGEITSPEKSQVEIADVRRMWITMNVRQEDAMRIALGQEVGFAPDGSPLEIHSQIDWISTEVDDKTRTVEARAEVDNPLVDNGSSEGRPQRLLRANTFGKGRIRVRQNPAALLVPNAAVQWDGTRYVVFVRVGELVFEAVSVEVGTIGDNVTEIVKGLEAGQSVATLGSHVLKAQLMRNRLEGQPTP